MYPHSPPPPPPRHYHPPPPPPPPPPPREVFEAAEESGAARCYFCGHKIAEADVRKTEFHVGHGHKMMVMICPECRGKKERGEGPFKRTSPIVYLIPIVIVLGFGAFIAYKVFGIPFVGTTSVPAGQSATAGGLTLTVNSVEKGTGQFRVHMTAKNQGRDALTLPLFGRFKVIDNLGNQYEADPFDSTFTESVAPGATVSGYAKMKTGLNESATTLKVTFTTVFGSFAVDSITVEGVPAR